MSGKIREYEGDGIVVRYDARRCIHFAECVKGLPAVFNPDARPWIAPRNVDAGDVARTVMQCPTGALTFQPQDAEAGEPVPASNRLVASQDGPLLITGDLRLVLPDMDALQHETRVALCRCGASSNKPFCDGAHTDAGFVDPGTVPDRTSADAQDGPVTFRPAPNGPLLFEGPLEIRSADGGKSFVMNKGALCRCGQSSNRPLCDGTHRTVKFEA